MRTTIQGTRVDFTGMTKNIHVCCLSRKKLFDNYQFNLGSVDRVQMLIEDYDLYDNEKLYCLKQYSHVIYLYHAVAFQSQKQVWIFLMEVIQQRLMENVTPRSLFLGSTSFF